MMPEAALAELLLQLQLLPDALDDGAIGSLPEAVEQLAWQLASQQDDDDDDDGPIVIAAYEACVLRSALETAALLLGLLANMDLVQTTRLAMRSVRRAGWDEGQPLNHIVLNYLGGTVSRHRRRIAGALP
jgi:hypothetical protein